MRGPGSKDAFELLLAQKESIEKEIGQTIEWQKLEHKKGSRIVIYKTGVLIDNAEQREQSKVWLVEMADKFFKAFSGRIKQLDLPEASDEAES